MKKLLLSFAAMGLITGTCAQQNPTAMKYTPVISAGLAKKHLSIIASDEFEGRETGKPGAEKAANYIAGEFKALGLEPIVNGSYFFDVPLVENTLSVSFSLDGKPVENGIDFYAYKPDGDRTVSVNDIVFIGYGTDAETGRLDLTGKVLVWINEDKPEAGKPTNTNYRASDARLLVLKNLQAKNPAMILAVNPEVTGLLKRFKGNITSGRLSIKKEAGKPAVQSAGIFWITTALADQLVKTTGKTYEQLKTASADGLVAAQLVMADVKISYSTQAKAVKAVDVLGFLPGSDAGLTDEVLVISAHYDHIGMLSEGTKGDRINNGADDDGSGTTGILEIARAFSQAKKDGHGPRRSLLFLGNVGEEKGLLGSEYYTDHPVIPLEKTIADLNIDMIGRVGTEYIGKPDSANYVYVIGSSMLSSDLHKANENANGTYTKLDLDYKYDDPADPNRFYYRSDHYNFAKHGVPIIFYFNGVHADYHGLGDEVSKINFPLLAKRAQLVYYTAWELANADSRPVVDGKK